MAGTSLYPPIFNQSYMPAFNKNSSCRVYFSMSRYNSIGELYESGSGIGAAQISIKNQKTNRSMLKTSTYPSGIKLTTVQVDSSRDSDDKYYVVISTSDIEGGFNLNEYYKVQIRLSEVGKKSGELPNGIQKVDDWLGNNISHFSEWSTVVLIRPISMPSLTLNNFNMQGDTTTFSLESIVVSGSVKFDLNDSETLKSYRIYLYDANEVLLEDSGEILTDAYNSPNSINYTIKYDLQDSTLYYLGVQILTRNLYQWPSIKKFPFKLNLIYYGSFETGTLMSAVADSESGRIKIRVYNTSRPASLTSNIVIRRANSKDNFLFWNTMTMVGVPPNGTIDVTWDDTTIESGVWYKYKAQKINAVGYYSLPIYANTQNADAVEPLMVVYEDIFLTAGNKQLKLRYDPSISSYGYTISESTQETIGSKYPFVRRNGSVKYRSFPLGGTITTFMDIRLNMLSASLTDLYGDNKDYYDTYNSLNNITMYNNMTYEKDFRDKVLDFLYENDIKLFKSGTEGNILVKLTAISLTPKTAMREIYSFSCTAVEVDECTLDNMEKYGILDRGFLLNLDDYDFPVLGQIYRPDISIYENILDRSVIMGETISDNVPTIGDDFCIYDYRHYYQNDVMYFGTKELVSTIITDSYQYKAQSGYYVKVKGITYLKIEMSSPPYMINFDEGGTPHKSTYGSSTNRYMGYIVEINGKRIAISSNGIYELTDDNTFITSIKFPYGKEQGSLSYIANIVIKQDMSLVPTSYANINTLGQRWGTFGIKDSIYRELLLKYTQQLYSNTKLTEAYKLQKIYGVTITSAAPGSVVFVKEKEDTEIQRHIIGPTGTLDFYDTSTNITGLYFYGVHLNKMTDRTRVPKENEYFDTGLTWTLLDKDSAFILGINKAPEKDSKGYNPNYKTPIKNGVYTLDEEDWQDTLITSLAKVHDDSELILSLVERWKDLTKRAIYLRNDFVSLNSTNRKWIQSIEKSTALNDVTKAAYIDAFYYAVLLTYLRQSDKIIFYDGGWHPFNSETGDVMIRQNPAIIDYMCNILLERY